MTATGASPSALQWTLKWETASISSVTVANATVTLSQTTATTTSISLNDVVASNDAGVAIPATGTGANLTISTSAPDLSLTIGAPAGTLAPGGTVTFPLVGTVSGSVVAGVQWTLSWASSDITSVSVTGGSAATIAGKSVSCRTNGTKLTCLATGTNATPISGGAIANVSATLASTASASIPIGLSGIIAASTQGGELKTTGTAGLLSLLKSISCSPRSFVTPASTTCTVSLSAAAPAGGFIVTLSASSAAVTLPSTITIPAGQSTATFSAAAAAVMTNTPVTLTATRSPATSTYAIILVPPPSLLSMTCTQAVVRTGGSAACSVTLTAAATVPLVVSLASDNPAVLLPASVVVPVGKNSASFSAVVGGVATAQNATLTATAGTAVKKARLSIAPAAAASVFNLRNAQAVRAHLQKRLPYQTSGGPCPCNS